MDGRLTADDLWPLVQKLSPDQQMRLAKMTLFAASYPGEDAMAYQAQPPAKDEFGTEENPLAWEAEGWEEFDAPR